LFETPTGCQKPGLLNVWKSLMMYGCNLKQFDGLTWLTLIPRILRQIYVTDLLHKFHC